MPVPGEVLCSAGTTSSGSVGALEEVKNEKDASVM
jgi:hypothetical protein